MTPTLPWSIKTFPSILCCATGLRTLDAPTTLPLRLCLFLRDILLRWCWRPSWMTKDSNADFQMCILASCWDFETGMKHHMKALLFQNSLFIVMIGLLFCNCSFYTGLVATVPASETSSGCMALETAPHSLLWRLIFWSCAAMRVLRSLGVSLVTSRREAMIISLVHAQALRMVSFCGVVYFHSSANASQCFLMLSTTLWGYQMLKADGDCIDIVEWLARGGHV